MRDRLHTHSWEVSRHRLSAVNPQATAVLLDGPRLWSFMQWGAGQRYHFSGVREQRRRDDGLLARQPDAVQSGQVGRAPSR